MDTIEKKDALNALTSKVSDQIKQLKRADLLPSLHRTQRLLDVAPFTIGIVGEFSRGKSTLINDLIGEEVLPVGALATTKHHAKVRYGDEKRISWVVSQASDAITSIHEFDAPDGDVSGFFLVEMPNEHLKKSNLQLIDFPGAGDLQGKWFDQVVETVSACDAALMVISAMMPMSQTEQKFIEQQLIEPKIPRLGFVITWLDQTSTVERTKIIQHIRQRVQQIAPGSLICTAQDASEIGIEEGLVQGKDNVFELMTQWASSPEHPALKAEQVKHELAIILQSLEKGLAEKLASVEGSQKEQAKDLQDRLRQLDQNRVNWEDVNLEMSDRKKQMQEIIRSALDGSKMQVVEKLQIDLNQSADPKQWLNEQLPNQLKQKFIQICGSVEGQVESKLRADLQWLETEVQRRLEWQYKNKINTGIESTSQIVKNSQKEDLQDLSQLRKLTRLGGSGVFVLGLVFSNPLGVVLGAGGLILGEWYHNKSIAKQKQELSKHIESIVDYNIAEVMEAINRKIEQKYGEIIQEVRSEENIWYIESKESIENMNSNNIQQDQLFIQDQIQTLKELKPKIY